MNAAYSRLAKIVESDDDKVALAAIKIVIDAKDQLLSTTVAPNHDAPKIAPTSSHQGKQTYFPPPRQEVSDHLHFIEWGLESRISR
jgi:hypothetical protein